MLKLLRRDRRILALLTLTVAVVAFSSVSALASSPKPVNVGDNYFGAKTLHIKKGTRVRWNWVGYLPHNVAVSRGPSKFHSRDLVRGASFSHVFRRRGRWNLYCTLHPSMKMTVFVR